MTAPRIIPTSFPLPHAHRMELPTWCADKLREAFTLGGRPFNDMDEANAVYAALGKAGPYWIGIDWAVMPDLTFRNMVIHHPEPR